MVYTSINDTGSHIITVVAFVEKLAFSLPLDMKDCVPSRTSDARKDHIQSLQSFAPFISSWPLSTWLVRSCYVSNDQSTSCAALSGPQSWASLSTWRERLHSNSTTLRPNQCFGRVPPSTSLVSTGSLRAPKLIPDITEFLAFADGRGNLTVSADLHQLLCHSHS